MKKIVISLLFIAFVFCLTACTDTSNDETLLTEPDTENISISSTEGLSSSEEYSFEFSEPDFPYPLNFSEFNDIVMLNEYDDVKKDGQKENYYKNGKLLYTMEFDADDRITRLSVYETDEKTLSAVYDYKYTDSGTEVDIDFYKNGAVSDRRKFTFYSDGVIKSIYDLKTDTESGAQKVNTYEFNEKGELVNGINSDDFSQLLLEAIMNGLQNKL